MKITSTQLEHSCLHKSPPNCVVLCLSPGGIEYDVGRLRVRLDGTQPGSISVFLLGIFNPSIALMMFDCSRSQCSRYFGDMYSVPSVSTVAAHSRLRSADHGDLIISRVRSTRFGSCSSHACGPTIWNKLSQDLQNTDAREQF